MSAETVQKQTSEQMLNYAEKTTRLALDELLKLARHISTIALSIILASNAYVASVNPSANYQLTLVISTLSLLLSIIFATLLYYIVLQIMIQLAADARMSVNLQPVLELVYKQRENKRKAKTKTVSLGLGIGLIGMGLSFVLGIAFIFLFVFLNADLLR
jgi:hypothetical protein